MGAVTETAWKEDVLAQLVARHLKTDGGLSFQPIRTGKFNRSYFVRLDGREVVLRIAPPPGTPVLFYEKDMMRQEPEIHRIVREKTRVPVAEILAWDFSRTLIESDYLLMEKLPGLPASELPLSRSVWNRALEEVGQYLRQVHAIEGPAFGYIGPHRPMEAQPSWWEAFRLMWQKLVAQIVEIGAYRPDQGAWLVEALEKRRAYFDREVSPSLLHMDIWSQNILLDASGHVTGILDWDRALYGDPEIEYAVLDYCGISEPAFWRGYGKERDRSPAARVRFWFYFLYEHQKYIVIRALRSGRWEEAMRYRDDCWRLAQQWFTQ
ncbi:MAG: aminoglycoside phosphotransferase family protein [candidate division KSB1 bacterium]|nr:aminoglycoside phosphotransferase family protein [candidate division KSB1 bacterium]